MNVGAITEASCAEGICKVCRSKSQYFFSLDNKLGKPPVLDIFLCNYCGLLFVANTLTVEQIAHAHGMLDQTKYYQEIAVSTERKISRAVRDIRKLLPSGPNNSSLLDIGCGDGHFLEALTKTFPSIRVAGHELPGESATACQTKGLTVFTCALEDLSQQFSIISLLDVAEHIPHPNRTFVSCHSLLKTDGHIYIHTPRRCFWDNVFLALTKIPGLRNLSRTWFHTRLSIFHLQLWTDKALKLSLQKAGFEFVYLKSEMELSWPLDMYVRVYLGQKLHFSPVLMMVATAFAKVLFVWLRTLRNKAICLAQKRGDA